MKEDQEERLYLECHCGPHLAIEISKLDFTDNSDEDLLSLSFWVPCFYAYQGSVFSLVWERLKLSFNILFKGEHYIHDMLLDKENTLRLKEYINKF